MPTAAQPAFTEIMECLAVKKLPEGPQWSYEIKLDGYRVEVVKADGKLTLFSRKSTDLSERFPYILAELAHLPDGTVIDGELVALDPSGRPSFTLLQSFRSAEPHIRLFAFDILFHKNRNQLKLPLAERRIILAKVIKPKGHIDISLAVETTLAKLLKTVRENQLEGIVAKRTDSLYESGQRSGAWAKHRINRGQEFVIGGYLPGPHGFESVVIGFWRGKDLIYSHRLRNGFVPATRTDLFKRFAGLEIKSCPFSNLPQNTKSRWGGEGFTAEKMEKAVWLKPETVIQVEFLEWNGGDHLRHAKYIGIREDKDPRKVIKED